MLVPRSQESLHVRVSGAKATEVAMLILKKLLEETVERDTLAGRQEKLPLKLSMSPICLEIKKLVSV